MFTMDLLRRQRSSPFMSYLAGAQAKGGTQGSLQFVHPTTRTRARVMISVRNKGRNIALHLGHAVYDGIIIIFERGGRKYLTQQTMRDISTSVKQVIVARVYKAVTTSSLRL